MSDIKSDDDWHIDDYSYDSHVLDDKGDVVDADGKFAFSICLWQ
jgi:hypothetical protein